MRVGPPILPGLAAAFLLASACGAQAQSAPLVPPRAEAAPIEAPTGAVEDRADTPAALSGSELPLAVLVLDPAAAYASSRWGVRAQQEIEDAARLIEADNTRLEAELTSEEQSLTAERQNLSQSEFRKKAEAFDARAQSVRRERQEIALDLAARAQADRAEFLDQAAPLLTEIMQQRSAAVVMDRRQVMVASSAVDITTELVARFDDLIGEGEGLPDAPEPEPARQ